MSQAGRARAARKRRQFEMAGKAAVVVMAGVTAVLLLVLTMR